MMIIVLGRWGARTDFLRVFFVNSTREVNEQGDAPQGTLVVLLVELYIWWSCGLTAKTAARSMDRKGNTQTKAPAAAVVEDVE